MPAMTDGRADIKETFGGTPKQVAENYGSGCDGGANCEGASPKGRDMTALHAAEGGVLE